MARLKKPLWVQMQDGNYRTTVGPLVIEACVRVHARGGGKKWEPCISYFQPHMSTPTDVAIFHGTPVAKPEHAKKSGFTMARKMIKDWAIQLKPVNKASKKRWGRGKKNKRTGV